MNDLEWKSYLEVYRIAFGRKRNKKTGYCTYGISVFTWRGYGRWLQLWPRIRWS